MELSLAQNIAVWTLPVIFAITLHEVAHGWAASFFGDQTARMMGRLSLNPMKHIDFIGTVLVPLLMLMVSNFIFGWAKPVPVEPRNMRHPKTDMAIVALAGPLANLVMAFMWAGVAKLAITYGDNGFMSKPLTLMGIAGIQINVVLGVLNLIPLPPLDGGSILMGVLPGKASYYFHQIQPYGFFILLLLLFTGALSYIMAYPVIGLINFIGNVFGL